MSKPKHYLFTNNTLNKFFCSNAEDSRQFCNNSVDLMRIALKLRKAGGSKIPVEDAIVDYAVALTECAFELGVKLSSGIKSANETKEPIN